MTTQLDPQELAQRVVNFIDHNDIDVTKFSMDKIVKGYFEAQLEAIETAGAKVLEDHRNSQL